MLLFLKCVPYSNSKIKGNLSSILQMLLVNIIYFYPIWNFYFAFVFVWKTKSCRNKWNEMKCYC